MIEACFKAFARALRAAIAIDPTETGVPSTKGTLTGRNRFRSGTSSGPTSPETFSLLHGLAPRRSGPQGPARLMPTRTSIELYPEGCRLIDVSVPSRGAGTAGGSQARVRSFASLEAADGSGLSAQLASLRADHKLARTAWVTVWGLRSAQQFLRLPPAKPADLEALAAREARKEIAPLETDGDRATIGIMAGSEVVVGTQRRREVSMVAVSTTEVLRRIQPIVDAGFVVEGVLTPALALTAVARAGREVVPGSAGAFVALGPRATCLAIVRDGILLFARELPWGYEADPAPDAVGARLGSELRRSVLFFKQTFRASVDYISLCGDMPNLRALTAPLGEALSVPVQIGDSLAGIDAAAVPHPADRFHGSLAALRLTIAAGTELAPPINLLPASIRSRSRITGSHHPPVRDGCRKPQRCRGGLPVRRSDRVALRG